MGSGIAEVAGGVPYRILYNKYYVDEMYDATAISGTFAAARGSLAAACAAGYALGAPALVVYGLAAIHASEGKFYRYPLTIRFLN